MSASTRTAHVRQIRCTEGGDIHRRIDVGVFPGIDGRPVHGRDLGQNLGDPAGGR